MVKRRSKKRRIGSRTHGHGSSKRPRGAGNKGGRGRAGLGKKAEHKKFNFLKKQKLKKKSKKEKTGINLSEIDQKIDIFVKKGSAEKNKDGYIFYANKANYEKVLGQGKITKKIEIHSKKFSKKAKNKLKDEGLKFVEL